MDLQHLDAVRAGAYAIYQLFQKRLIFVLLIIAFSAVNSFWWNYLFLKTPTFIQAHRWIEENVPGDVPIAYVGGRFQTFLPNIENISYTGNFQEGYHDRLKVLLSKQDVARSRDVIYVSLLPGETKLEQLKVAQTNKRIFYVIDYFYNPADRLFDQSVGSFKLVARFNPFSNPGLESSVPEVIFDPSASFPAPNSNIKKTMFSLCRQGPYVEILKVL